MALKHRCLWNEKSSLPCLLYLLWTYEVCVWLLLQGIVTRLLKNEVLLRNHRLGH